MSKRFIERIVNGIIDQSSAQGTEMNPEIHNRIFSDFLNRFGDDHPDSVKRIIFKEYDPSIKSTRKPSLIIPDKWFDELIIRVANKSKMYSHLKTRTSTTDHIVQPKLISADSSVSQKTQSNSSDTYTSIVIDKNMKKFFFYDVEDAVNNHNLSEVLLDKLSTEIANYIDQHIVTTEQVENMGLESILLNNSVTGRLSEGMGTVAGYIEFDKDSQTSGDAFLAALMHFPAGYRERCRWYMNSQTAEMVKGLKFLSGETGQPVDLISDPSKQIDSNGILIEIFGHPVVINDNIPSTGIFAFIADLSRGYIFAKPNVYDSELMIDSNSLTEGKDIAALKMRIGGQVLQPAAMKFIKIKG